MSSTDGPCLGPEARATLLQVARQSVEHGVAHGTPLRVDAGDFEPELQEERATFVTLRLVGALCGCIGTCQPLQPMVEDVALNAHSAAFRDPRFAQVTQTDLPALRFHISLLSIPEPMEFVSEAELLEQIRPGVDGLLLAEGRSRGTLLPSVWDVLPEAESFLRQLKLKAGLAADHWSSAVTVQRYTAESIEEE